MSIIGSINLTATDQAVFASSLDRLMALVDSAAEHGGRYLAKGGTVDAAGGEPLPDRVLLLEFEHLGQARSWLQSPEFAQFTDLAGTCSHVHAMLIEGT